MLASSWVSQEGPAIPARIADIYGVGGVGEGFIWNSFSHCLIYLKNRGVGQNYFFIAVKWRG